jgi:hypothetical protein
MAEVPCFSTFSFYFLEFGAQVQASDFRFLYQPKLKKGGGEERTLNPYIGVRESLR